MKVKRLHPDAIIPSYAHTGDSGFDLRAVETFTIRPGEVVKARTGLAFEIPRSYEMQVRPKSGLSLLSYLTVILGTIDSNYRGEVGVILWNIGSSSFKVEAGMKIAQGVMSVVATPTLVEETGELSDTTRGTGGFGSTGLY